MFQAAVQARFRESDDEVAHQNHVDTRMPVVNLHPVDQRLVKLNSVIVSCDLMTLQGPKTLNTPPKSQPQ